MNQLVEGMKALQKKHVVHRDLKLQNILMTDNTLKIADFGLSTVLGEYDLAHSVVGNQLTMAPEVVSRS